MRRTWLLLLLFLALLAPAAALAAGCGGDDDDDDGDNDSDDDTDEPECLAPPEFCELCGTRDPADTLRPYTLQYDNDDPFSFQRHLKDRDIEVVHFIPEGPFYLEKIRLRFGGEAGTAIIHLYADLGRSTPDEEVDLIEPIEVEVPEDAGWIELDVSDREILFRPEEHFWIGYEHTGEAPWLSFDNGNEADDGTPSLPVHSMVKSQDLIDWARQQGEAFTWFAMEYSFMIRVEGAYFCEWAERRMKEVTEEAGLAGNQHMRTAWADLDGDGWDDIVLTHPGYRADSTNVFLNNGDGTFRDATQESGLSGNYQALNLMGDVDNDGDVDVYAGVYVPQDGSDAGARSAIFLNDGDAHFERLDGAGVDLEATTAAAAFGDYDRDGALDLYVGNWLLQYPQPASFTDWLFRGAGDGTFTNVTDAAGMDEVAQRGGEPCYGVVWGDYNNDDLPDIFVANYGRTGNFLWRNNGDGTFTEVSEEAGVYQTGYYPGGNSFGADFGDYENDGDLDLYVAMIAHPRYLPSTDISPLFRNLGAAGDWTFQDVREQAGIAYDEGEIEVSWIDFDNDGDLDLSLSDLYPLHYARLLRQNEDKSFTDVTYEAGVVITPATNHAWADYNHDGQPDLLITQNAEGGSVHLYENHLGDGNHWLMVRLVGTESNRDGVGARVTVITGEQRQMREVKGGKGHFNSQPSMVQHFGLGDRDHIDGLQVVWPSGQVDQYTDIAVDQYITVTEGAADIEEE